MAKYVLCPRCELNYIDEETQEYCDVCIKEMQGAKTFTDDLEEEEEREETELCPICGENYMRAGEKMCDSCKKRTQYEDEEEDPDQDDAWRSYLDDDPDDGLDIDGIPEGELEDDDLEEEEEEEEIEEEEDFEYVSPDDYDFDDDDDEDDDDDLGDDDF